MAQRRNERESVGHWTTGNGRILKLPSGPLCLQQLFQTSEWRVGRHPAFRRRAAGTLCCLQLPLVFIVMAVETKQFPVAAVRWVVVVIVIAVVNGQLTEVGAREHSSAATADPRIDLQRLLTVAIGALVGSASRLGHDAIEPARVS